MRRSAENRQCRAMCSARITEQERNVAAGCPSTVYPRKKLRIPASSIAGRGVANDRALCPSGNSQRTPDAKLIVSPDVGQESQFQFPDLFQLHARTFLDG